MSKKATSTEYQAKDAAERELLDGWRAIKSRHVRRAILTLMTSEGYGPFTSETDKKSLKVIFPFTV